VNGVAGASREQHDLLIAFAGTNCEQHDLLIAFAGAGREQHDNLGPPPTHVILSIEAASFLLSTLLRT
jgi:hypothetical protein